MTDKTQLLNEINTTSFAVNDLVLYLDTHPDDVEGLTLFHECNGRRNKAIQEFEQEYYPLTTDCIHNAGTVGHWSWGDAPAPWEGGEL